MADMNPRRDPKPEVPQNAPRGAVPDNTQKARKATVESASSEALQDARNNAQKGWFEEYVKGDAGLVSFGTLGKLITAKPVEGIVNTATLNQVPILGKIARWATVAAALGLG